MATDFIMPRLPDQQQQSPQYQYYYNHQQQQQQQQQQLMQQQQYQQQQHQYSSQPQSQSQSPVYPHPNQPLSQPQSRQISPLSTSNNGSPTQASPMSHHNQRLRPLFMPAVLRPNEYPSRRNSGKKGEGADDDSSPRPGSGLFKINSWGPNAFNLLTRRSTGDSGKCLDVDEEDDDSIQLNVDMFPQPSAHPTREHWKPDSESIHCDEPSCSRTFNYFTRRHHCRRCGNIFCDTHSAYLTPLDENANYNPRGVHSRACAHCYSEFKTWRSRTNSQASSENSSIMQGPNTAPSSPLVATPTATKAGGPAQRQEIAASVPRDWNWSTF